MSDLISRESLKHRINLNYNIHQYIDTQSIKDIINTEPSVEDKTVEELEKIKAEIEDMWIKSAKDLRTGEVIYENLCEHSEVLDILNKHIFELKGENK